MCYFLLFILFLLYLSVPWRTVEGRGRQDGENYSFADNKVLSDFVVVS